MGHFRQMPRAPSCLGPIKYFFVKLVYSYFRLHFTITNFGKGGLQPLQLLHKMTSLGLEEIFSNVCVSLRIFCTIPVTVASAERSFSKLSHIKNYFKKHHVTGQT